MHKNFFEKLLNILGIKITRTGEILPDLATLELPTQHKHS